jgi:hypothetical protein
MEKCRKLKGDPHARVNRAFTREIARQDRVKTLHGNVESRIDHNGHVRTTACSP